MRPAGAVWTITLDGEADETFERLMGGLRGYVVDIETTDGENFDGILLEANTFQPTDEDGNPMGTPRRVDRPFSVHVY